MVNDGELVVTPIPYGAKYLISSPTEACFLGV